MSVVCIFVNNNVAIVIHYSRVSTGLHFVVQQKRRKQSVFSVTKCELILLLVIRGVACRRNIDAVNPITLLSLH